MHSCSIFQLTARPWLLELDIGFDFSSGTRTRRYQFRKEGAWMKPSNHKKGRVACCCYVWCVSWCTGNDSITLHVYTLNLESTNLHGIGSTHYSLDILLSNIRAQPRRFLYQVGCMVLFQGFVVEPAKLNFTRYIQDWPNVCRAREYVRPSRFVWERLYLHYMSRMHVWTHTTRQRVALNH